MPFACRSARSPITFFAPGKDHGIRLAQLVRPPDHAQADVRFDPERVEVGEVRDVGEIDDGDVDMLAFGGAAVDHAVLEADGVLLGEAQIAQVGDDAEDGASGPAEDVLVGIGEERLLTPEAVHDEPLDQCPFPLRQALHRPDERGVDAPPGRCRRRSGRTPPRRGPCSCLRCPVS